MRIESALNASREGLSAHGAAIAVISDNISNADTTAFKAARAEFSDVYSDYTGSKSTGPVVDGNGAKVTSVRQIQISGTAEFTGRSLDVAIAGNGYFITGDATGSSGSLGYTRAGNFQLDKEGYLINADGSYVLGSPATSGSTTTGTTTGTTGTTTSGTLSRLNLASLQGGATATANVALSGNVSSSLATTTVPAAPATFSALASAASHIETVEAYDSLGTPQTLTLGFFKTATNTWTVNAYADGGSVTGGTKGTPVQVGTVAGVTFGSDGLIPAASQAAAKITATPAWSGGAAAGNINIDLSKYTQYATGSALASKTQDGLSVGQIKSYEIDKSGKINASLSNGSTVTIGTLQLATFTNVDGLDRTGNNSYTTGPNAGTKTVGAPGTSGLGTTEGASLERSTTDLSSEFTNLIVMQRGYQANSQTLSASNEIIKDTLGLIR